MRIGRAAVRENRGLAEGRGAPAGAGRVILLPWLILVGTLGVVSFAVAACARHWWTVTGRLHYLLIALACVGLTAEILSLGLS
jgi:hypothetical protein